MLKAHVIYVSLCDPDKLGRGGIWRGQLTNCIHQNHIFRVRLGNGFAIPEFISAQIGSAYGKRYFLKAAKQTTGIATINMTQLTKFPVLLPNLPLQGARPPCSMRRHYSAMRSASYCVILWIPSPPLRSLLLSPGIPPLCVQGL